MSTPTLVPAVRRWGLAALSAVVAATACGCGPTGGAAAEPAPAASPASSPAAGPCDVETGALSDFVGEQLGPGRDASREMSMCEWVTPGGVGVVVGRSSVSDWLRLAPGLFDDLRSSGVYDDDALAVLDDVESRLGAGDDLDLDESCEVYRLTLRSFRDPEIDGITTRLDVDAGTRATVDVRDAEKQTLHVMGCDGGVVTTLQVVRSGLTGSDAETERALAVAAGLYR